MIPIKVKIGLRPNGHADHPDWMKLPLAEKERPEDHQIVKWKYDKTSGHEEASEDSPRGFQWGMMIVTKKFADEALKTFPDIVFKMTNKEAEDFWDNKAHGHIPKYRLDTEELNGLKVELELKEKMGMDVKGVKEQIEKALDPESPQLGIRKNKKKWKEAIKEF